MLEDRPEPVMLMIVDDEATERSIRDWLKLKNSAYLDVAVPSDPLPGRRFHMITVTMEAPDPRLDWIDWYLHLLGKLEPGGKIIGVPEQLKDRVDRSAELRPAIEDGRLVLGAVTQQHGPENKKVNKEG